MGWALRLCVWYSVDFSQQPCEGMFFYYPHFIDGTTRYREVISTSSHRTERNGGSGMEARMSSGILSPELQFSSVQSLSHVQLFATPWTVAHQASLSITNSRAYSNSCPSSLWCHSTISSSVIPFSSTLQSFPATGSFQMSPFFASGGQSIVVSASASFLPMNIQDWFPSELTGWISLQSKGLSRVFSNTTVQKHQFLKKKKKHQFFSTQLSLWSNSHIRTWLLEKP